MATMTVAELMDIGPLDFWLARRITSYEHNRKALGGVRK